MYRVGCTRMGEVGWVGGGESRGGVSKLVFLLPVIGEGGVLV